MSVREWILLLSRRKPAVLHETEPVWLPDYAVVEGGASSVARPAPPPWRWRWRRNGPANRIWNARNSRPGRFANVMPQARNRFTSKPRNNGSTA